ncbi:MAG: cytochrome c biogenesis protein CcsA [Verrucomicrobiota bacterium]
MDQPDRLLIWLATAAYFLAVVYAAVRLFNRRPHARSITYPIIVTGFLLQTAGLYLRGLEIGACPLGNSFEIIQFVLWSTIFLFLIVGPVFRVTLLGTASAAFVSVVGIVSLLMPGWDRPHTAKLFGGDPLIEFHAALSVFSYGIFGLLASVAALYLLQYYALEKKWKSRVFYFLPSIVKVDNLARRLLPTGLVILTFAFASGLLVWFEDAWSELHMKLLAVFVLWIGYGAVWTLRQRDRISPQRAAVTFLALYVFALFSLWPVKSSHDLGEFAETTSQSPVILSK